MAYVVLPQSVVDCRRSGLLVPGHHTSDRHNRAGLQFGSGRRDG
jgi:hypothetical protein